MSLDVEEFLAPLGEYLSNGIVDVEWFSRKLVEKQVISQSSSDSAMGKLRHGTADSAKAHPLMKEVIAQIQADESKRKGFNDILMNEEPLQLVGSKLRFSRPTKSAHKRKGEASKQEIRCQHIGDEELQKLCGILSVEILELDLSWSKEREILIRKKWLIFRKNGITEEGATELSKALVRCPRLRKLDLCRNCIGEVGSRELSKTLVHCTNLQYLDLSWNHLSDKGIIALSEGLKNCEQLVTLNLHTNFMTGNGAIELSKALKHFTLLQTLDVSRNEFGAEGCVALSEALKHCQQLKSLNFASGSIHDKGAVALSEAMKCFSQLQDMNLSWNSIGDKGACSLGEALRQSKQLLSLDLCKNMFGEAGFTALTEGLKHCSHLQSLDLSRNGLTQKAAVLLADTLTHCKELQKLDLSFNDIRKAGAEVLSKGLKNCARLHTLDLHKNKLGDKGSIALGEALEHCTELQSLVLSENDVHEDGAKALSRALGHCSQLQKLDLSWNTIGKTGAKALSEALGNCPNLQELDLHKNKIKDEGTIALCEALQRCKQLKSLILSENGTKKGAINLIEALKNCNQLQILDLSKNKLVKGVIALSEARTNWPHLLNFDTIDEHLWTSSETEVSESRVSTAVEVLAQTDITIRADESIDFEWEGYGFRLYAPKGALPDDTPECSLHVAVTLPGQFEIDEKYEFISAVYWIESPIKFAKPLDLEIQHSAVVSDSKQLQNFTFVRILDQQHPYQFHPVENGVFHQESSYGKVSVTCFSGIGAAIRKFLTDLISYSRPYVAQIFTSILVPKRWEIYFVVTEDLQPFLTAVQNNLKGSVPNLEKAMSFQIEFEQDEIKLEVPEETKQNGWVIVPKHHPQIKRTAVRRYRQNREPPKCELLVEWIGDNVDTLPVVELHLNGVTHPNDYCRVNLSHCSTRSLSLTSSGSDAFSPTLSSSGNSAFSYRHLQRPQATNSGGKSKELKTLEECLPTIQDFLSDGVVDLTWFAGKLTEKGLIHRQAANAVLDRQGTTNMERACGLMNAVVAQVKLDEEKYRRFCTILRDEDALSALDKELADKFLQKST